MRLLKLIQQFVYELLKMPKISTQYRYFNLLVFFLEIIVRHAVSAVIIRWSLGSLLWPNEEWTFKQILQLSPIIILFEVAYEMWCVGIEVRIHEFFKKNFKKDISPPDTLDELTQFFDDYIYQKDEPEQTEPRMETVHTPTEEIQ